MKNFLLACSLLIIPFIGSAQINVQIKMELNKVGGKIYRTHNKKLNKNTYITLGYDASYNAAIKKQTISSNGDIEEEQTSIPAQLDQNMSIADLNGDGYPDLTVSGGLDENEEPIAPSIYLYNFSTNKYEIETGNSGLPSLSFTNLQVLPFVGNLFYYAGFDENYLYHAYLYKYLGGKFTQYQNQSVAVRSDGFMIPLFANNDTHVDFMIAGNDENFNWSVLLYINNGDGTFTQKSSEVGNPGPVKPMAIDLGTSTYTNAINTDVDGDGDEDIIMAGSKDNGEPLTQIFKNDGNANFTEFTGHQIKNVSGAKLYVADLDGDAVNELLVLGSDINFDPVTEIYKNNGNGVYTKINLAPIEPMYNANALFSDANNDGKIDLILSGEDNNFNPTTVIYYNQSTQVGMFELTGMERSYASPNPNVGSFNLNFGELSASEVNIIDVKGTTVAQYKDVNQLHVNLNLPAGMYFIKAKLNGSIHTEKIVVE